MLVFRTYFFLFLTLAVRKDGEFSEAPEYVNFNKGAIDGQSGSENPVQPQEMAYLALTNDDRVVVKVGNSPPCDSK